MMDAPAFDAKRFARLALPTLVLLSMVMVQPAKADGIVSVGTEWGQGQWPVAAITAEAACRDGILAAWPPDYISMRVEVISGATPGYGTMKCFFTPPAYWGVGTAEMQWGNFWYRPSACPVNSTGTTTCTCNTGYQPDLAGTSCVPAACPAHAHGTPCVCDTGYKFDAARTSCVLEQYTIALSGLGGVVMPNATLATAYAEVTASTGTAKSGAQVTLDLKVVPELQGQLPVTYTGTLSTYAGSTGADGRLTFEFRAPTAGGTHTITASCTNCTNQATGTIRVPGCLVKPLKELPADDLCAQSLDAGLGVDVNGKCPPLDVRLPGQMQCFANKIAATNATASPAIPYAGPTATIRNTAYQGHLQDVWDKMIELNKDVNRNNEACRPLRDKVIAEKGCDSSGNCDASQCTSGSHCLAYQPATYSNHSTGTAFDVPKSTINGLLRELTQIPLTPTLQAQRIWIADWLAKPAACNLYWGGNFTDPGPDYVHFQLPY